MPTTEQHPPPRTPTPPGVALPAGACDTHIHVFGPYDRFPLLHTPAYKSLNAPVASLVQMQEIVGTSRAVLVQPAPYGEDCGAILEAIAHMPSALRGIGAAGPETAAATLARWHAGGIRGLRFVDLALPGGGRRFPGAVGLDALWALAPVMREAGLHAQLWADMEVVAAEADRLSGLGFPVVIEHLARFIAGRKINDPAITSILRLLDEGRIWVKLTVARVSKGAPDYDVARPFHDALVAANPARLLWGSDWPYVGLDDAAPDLGRIIDLFDAWTGHDEALRRMILVDNPARLYGFA